MDPADEGEGRVKTLIGITFHFDDGTVQKVPMSAMMGGAKPDTGINWLNADECPIHGKWRALPGGVSKTTGKPYPAFWTCDVKGELRCNNKPSKEWVETHPPERVLPRTYSSEEFDSLPF
jgi:hypothetical protein